MKFIFLFLFSTCVLAHQIEEIPYIYGDSIHTEQGFQYLTNPSINKGELLLIKPNQSQYEDQFGRQLEISPFPNNDLFPNNFSK